MPAETKGRVGQSSASRTARALCAASVAFALIGVTRPAEALGSVCREPPLVSRFWERLDLLCARAASLQALSTPEAQQAAAYCATRQPPAFAAESEHDRAAVLLRLLQTTGVTAPGAAMARLPSPPSLLDSAVRKLAPDRSLETGALGSYLVGLGLGSACDQSGAGVWLRSTCAPLAGDQALLALRKALVADIVSIPSTILDEQRGRLPPDALQSMRLIAAVLDTAAAGADLWHLAKRMAQDVGSALPGAANPCAASDTDDSSLRHALSPVRLPNGTETAALLAQTIAPLPTTAADPTLLAALILGRIAEDGPRLDRPVNYYAAVVENLLRRAAVNPALQLSPLQRAAVEQLVRAARQMDAVLANLRAGRGGAQDWRALAQSMVDVARHAVSLAANADRKVPLGVPELVGALAVGDLRGAIPATMALIQGAGVAPPIPRGAQQALALGVDMAMARSEGELVSALRKRLIPVGPWTDELLLDVNLGATVLSVGNNKVELAGDLMVGWNDPSWGVAVRGAGKHYRLTTSPYAWTTTDNYEVAADAWYSVELDEAWRLDVRGAGGANRFSTGSDSTIRSLYLDFDERSWMARGLLQPGLRWQPGMDFAAGLWLGAGLQHESYHYNDIAARSRQEVRDETGSGLLLDARLRAEWHLIPGYLAARLRADARRYQIHREKAGFAVAIGQMDTSQGTIAATQTEVGLRGFLDAEAMRLAGFVPSVWGGLDYLRVSGAGVRYVAVPVLGAGIRREVF